MIASPHLSLSRPHFLLRRTAVRSPTMVAAAFATERVSATPSRPNSLYDVLGLEKKASAIEIKAAYRRLARTCHPDVRDGSSADEFMSVHAAYSTLSDPAKRAEYDRKIESLCVPPPRGYRFAGQAPRRTWETDQCW